jgi:NAD(P)-dependent dehydrogenase (short-subunit alcohol dehydrogenase family)
MSDSPSHTLIVGGTKGLGKAFVESIATGPDRVTVIARSPVGDGLRAGFGKSVSFITADATDPASFRSGLERAVSAGGKIRRLVLFQQYRGQEGVWNGKLACTLTATRDALEFLSAHFVREGDKAVVLLASIASRLVADEQDEGYHAAKAGLLGLCRDYACRLGPSGVRVNCVSPGTVLKEASKHFYLEQPELLEWLVEAIPLRRMGTAAEVASAIRFLLSPEASLITGQELIVDGGASLRSQESLALALFKRTRSRHRPEPDLAGIRARAI